MLTPKDILEISEPIEAVYQRTVDELLINIAHHFNISGWERTRYWEIKKLSEMGALTKESAAIIAKNTQMLPSEIEKAFLQVSEKACLDIDPQLREARAKGVIQGVDSDPTSSILMRQMVQGYADQAIDTMNMINTTMLESTRQAYLKGITTAVNTAMIEEAKQVLESEALAVTIGTETRVKAIRKAMNALVNTGITGFYDSAGRAWSAEAYAAMVVRTTAHNAAIQAVKTRQQEAGGGDIFQVSTHSGARPLCYPYQGKFFSWSTSGEFTDGAGQKHKYDIIDNSSYGEPAGLFGINCGHHPIPMIPNFSYPQDKPIESEEENRKEYEESQKQRAYERQIREAKRDVEIAKATGDEAAIKAAEQKVAQKQAQMRAYTKETGRPRRYDREKIAGTKDIDGYRGYRAQFGSDTPLTPKPTTPIMDGVKGMDASAVKEMSEVLAKSGNQDAINLYSHFADQLNVVDDKYKKTACFNRGKGGVLMNVAEAAKASNYEPAWEVAFHEFGHMIDYLVGKANTPQYHIRKYQSEFERNGQTLIGTIKSDFQSFKKSLGVSKAADVIPILKAENLSMYARANISDILEKCTGKSYPLGFGHGITYHKRDGATEREFFAEVLASAVTNPESYAQMERLFPNAVNMVWDIVREAVNV